MRLNKYNKIKNDEYLLKKFPFKKKKLLIHPIPFFCTDVDCGKKKNLFIFFKKFWNIFQTKIITIFMSYLLFLFKVDFLPLIHVFNKYFKKINEWKNKSLTNTSSQVHQVLKSKKPNKMTKKPNSKLMRQFNNSLS